MFGTGQKCAILNFSLVSLVLHHHFTEKFSGNVKRRGQEKFTINSALRRKAYCSRKVQLYISLIKKHGSQHLYCFAYIKGSY